MTYFFALVMMVGLMGCTNKQMARNFGGAETIELNPGEKVVTASWKETDLWVLVRMSNGKLEYREYSSFGIMEGKVVFDEN